ncbi:MAG: CHASE domain-containing protein [Acidobacteria bacterium]|nr:CHASE domain-containing protein [Acidobacteriota bacterium]
MFAFSIILTIGATFLFYQSARGKDQLRFQSGVNRIRFSMENRLGLYIAFLKAGRGFIESSKDLDHRKFTNFVESLELQKNYFGSQGIGYTKTVRRDGLENLVDRMKSEGFSDFRVFPDPAGDTLQPIVYLEPATESNRQALGFDMASEENRRAAMEQARDTGLAAGTGRVVLFQENGEDRQFGFLIYLPIYENGGSPATVESRRQNLSGFIYSPFRATNFLNEVQQNAGLTDIAIRIYDGSPEDGNLLAQTVNAPENNLGSPLTGSFSTRNEIEIGGRRWLIEYDSLPSFAIQSSANWTPLIFFCGLIFSLLLFGMTYWEASTRAKLQETADDLTESEKKIQGLFEKEQEARRVAETANATKDEFISVVSHELRTPLNAIAGWAQILKSGDLSKSTRELALQKIEKNLRLQTGLVEDLLNYSQLVSSREDLDKSEVDCGEIMDNVYAEIEQAAALKGIVVSKTDELDGQKILGDAEKIRIVFVNLMSNALKFTPAGGQIGIGLKAAEGFVEIVIEDSGRGIDPAFLPQIFDRFSQYDSSTTRIFGGLGLGLAVSKHIVRLHHGSIEAESEGEGKGAKFSVRLPVLRNY